MLAGHNKDVREEVFDRIDFLMELRHALDVAKDSIRTANESRKGDKDKKVQRARNLCRSLYESCACLTIHGEFKEELLKTKKTLKAMQDLVTSQDLLEDSHLAFLYVSLTYNLCRSRDDKVRPKKDEFPFNQLDEKDLNALEEFYDKMPAESRPAKNGEVDPGSAELAESLRAWCVLQSSEHVQRGAIPTGGAKPSVSLVVSHLSKCATNGNARVKGLIAVIMKFFCIAQGHRCYLVSSGGFRTLLGLVDLEDEKARDAARQALAQICIVTNPAVLQYSEQLDAVRPLVEMLEHKHELLQFEAAMGLTNLLTVSEELRSRAIKADCWRACRDLLFSDNENVQRACLEAMCNLTMA